LLKTVWKWIPSKPKTRVSPNENPLCTISGAIAAVKLFRETSALFPM
jgi:hypothetical protein